MGRCYRPGRPVRGPRARLRQSRALPDRPQCLLSPGVSRRDHRHQHRDELSADHHRLSGRARMGPGHWLGKPQRTGARPPARSLRQPLTAGPRGGGPLLSKGARSSFPSRRHRFPGRCALRPGHALVGHAGANGLLTRCSRPTRKVRGGGADRVADDWRDGRDVISRLRAFITGMAALAVLAVIVGGLPVVLYQFGGSPLPHILPGWHDLARRLASRDDGGTALAVIRDGAWLTWLLFTACVLAEAQAAVRRRQ